MLRMYDSLMKSGNFTAIQNKEDRGETLNSLSELIALCERDGFIPRYYSDGPQDKVDRVIQDMQDYVRTLVTEEMHLGTLIERAVKQIEMDKLRDAEHEIDEITEEEDFEKSLFTDNSESKVLNYDDYVEFSELAEELEKQNDQVFDLLESEDGG